MFWDGNVLIEKNFLNELERTIFYDWCIENAKNRKGFVDGITKDLPSHTVQRTDKRVTTRMAKEIDYPEIAYEIKDKIKNYISNIKKSPIIHSHGKDGLVISVTYDGGDVYEHLDPKIDLNFSCLRCNILLSKPEEGGTIYINSKPYDINAGDLHCYLVSEYPHRVDKCFGETPRVMLMYGWLINKEDWEEGKHLPIGPK
jgi:hypothetical protein